MQHKIMTDLISVINEKVDLIYSQLINSEIKTIKGSWEKYQEVYFPGYSVNIFWEVSFKLQSISIYTWDSYSNREISFEQDAKYRIKDQIIWSVMWAMNDWVLDEYLERII